MEQKPKEAQSKTASLPSGNTTVPLSRKNFVVTGIDNSDITNIAVITVNGHHVHGTPSDFNADRFAGATITATAPGYEEKTFTTDVNPEKPIEITLKRLECTFHKTVRLTNGSKAELLLYGPRVPFRSSPLRGYRVEDNNIFYKGPSIWAERFQGFMAAVLLMVAVWAVYTFLLQPEVTVIPDSAIVLPETQTVSSAEEPAEEPAQENDKTPTEEAAAIVYLDDNDSWLRDDLELFPQTKGLFDALNHYRVDEILKYSDALSASDNFTEIVNILRAQKPGRVYNGIFDVDNRAVSFSRLVTKFKRPETAEELARRRGTENHAQGVNNAQ